MICPVIRISSPGSLIQLYPSQSGIQRPTISVSPKQNRARSPSSRFHFGTVVKIEPRGGSRIVEFTLYCAIFLSLSQFTEQPSCCVNKSVRRRGDFYVVLQPTTRSREGSCVYRCRGRLKRFSRYSRRVQICILLSVL